ncbi:hypothetical protein AURDEDRAFT_171774 [Auricularia subglabra TFB-10046 SS5]|nr:hypothetical protein AURDEDRAFT_171774 [Auricularia subglabra TFB-10046 SS5]
MLAGFSIVYYTVRRLARVATEQKARRELLLSLRAFAVELLQPLSQVALVVGVECSRPENHSRMVAGA